MKKSLLAAFISISASPSLGAFASYTLLENPVSGTKVLIIGDRHTGGCKGPNDPRILHELNVDHIKALMTCLEKVSRKPHHGLLLFEFSEKTSEMLGRLNEADGFLAATFKPLVEWYLKNQPSSLLKPYEPRGFMSDRYYGHVETILTIDTLIKQKQFTLPLAGNPFWKFLVQTYKNYSDKIKVEEFLLYCENNKKLMEGWQNNYSSSSNEHKIYQSLLARYEKSLRSIRELIAQYHAKTLVDMLLNICMHNAESTKKLGDAVCYIDELLRRDFDYLFADAGFLQKILLVQKQVKNCIFICGLGHVEPLTGYLKECGYQQIKKNAVLTDHPDGFILHPSGLNPGVNFIGEICTLIIDLLSAPKNIPHCARCKYAHEKLMNCGRCREAQYCSKNCQMSHWPEHKKICTPK